MTGPAPGRAAQHNEARDHGTVYSVLYGDQHVHEAPAPAARWPHRVGPVPLVVEPFQDRAALAALGEAGAATVVVTGLGGTGKTQLAARYARQIWAGGELDLLVWVTATSRQAVVDAYARAAEDVTGVRDADATRGADRFLGWLAADRGRRWLVVLDDVTRPGDLNDLWPAGSGRTLVTTRRRDPALGGNGRRIVGLEVFSPAEAAGFLATRLEPEQLDGAGPLAEALGFLPLALAQAAAFMAEPRPAGLLDCVAYRALWTDRTRELADVVPDPDSETLPDGQNTGLAGTWSLSLQAADRARPPGLATPVLALASFLDPAGVPVPVLTAPAVLTHLGRDAEAVHRALGTLHRFGLADLDLATGTLRVHALVQRVTREATAEKAPLVRVLADALGEVWPGPEPRAEAQVLGDNAVILFERAGAALWDRPEGGHPLVLRVAKSLHGWGRHTAAAALAREQFDQAGRALGPDHLDTLVLRAFAGMVRGSAGDLGGAVEDLRAFLAHAQPQLGDGHPGVLAARHNLANLLGRRGHLDEAMALLEEVLAQEVATLGPDDPSTLTTRVNLAQLHGVRGDPARAAQDLGEVLHLRRRRLGPRHPETLTALSSLAYWRGRAGDVPGAMQLFRSALVNRIRVLGPDHPDTLTTRANRAQLIGESGDRAQALAELDVIVEEWTRSLGRDHPETLNARANQAAWLGETGDPAGALRLLEEVLAAEVRVLGRDSPHTLKSRFNVAQLRGLTGDRAGARAGLGDLLPDQVRVLGPEHPDTRQTRNCLSRW